MEKFQQGGQAPQQNLKEIELAFMTYLVEDAAAQGVQIKSEQDLKSYAQQLGEEGLKVKYQEFIQKMQGGAVKAQLGAKLQYFKKLKGSCPEGEELVYFKQGGRICKACKKKDMLEKGKKLNAVEEFKDKKKVNPNDTINTKTGPKDLNGRTKYPKFDSKKATLSEKNRASEKDYLNPKKSKHDPSRPK